MDQKLDFAVVKLLDIEKTVASMGGQVRFLSALVCVLSATGAGMLGLFIPDLIGGTRKSRNT
ncbi:hypothetical protein TWF481_006202 [Arthrobotrys musiformis]|uniref:Major facilitator superfamily (MFS) profile domain-containing protein n=1 Tax=Arthrobotrys musiformis TaxID=47236 RepID=A0AAV9WHD5_9PEZI